MTDPAVTVLQGDCREVMRSMEPQSVDCIVTDPPYGETSLTWDKWQTGWLSEAARVLTPTGSMWCFGTMRMFMANAAEFAKDWRMSHDIVWEKHNGSGLFNDRFRRVHEQAAHFYLVGTKWAAVHKVAQYTNDAKAKVIRKKGRHAHWIGATGDSTYRSEDGGPRLARSVIFAHSENGRAVHPTQKPVPLVTSLLEYACPPGGIVLDPFGGSGTTGIAARATGRRAILIEAEPKYIAVIEARIANDVPLLAEVGL